VPEVFHLYVEALVDESNRQREALQDNAEHVAPHLAEEAQTKQRRAVEHSVAYQHMTPEQLLEMGYRLYG